MSCLSDLNDAIILKQKQFWWGSLGFIVLSGKLKSRQINNINNVTVCTRQYSHSLENCSLWHVDTQYPHATVNSITSKLTPVRIISSAVSNMKTLRHMIYEFYYPCFYSQPIGTNNGKPLLRWEDHALVNLPSKVSLFILSNHTSIPIHLKLNL